MIIDAQIITRPDSGEYTERIYDHENVWNSGNWSFVKFTNDDYFELCGQFRGAPVQVAISGKHNTVLVLTSDYLFQLDKTTGDVTDLENSPSYKNLTVTPGGDFIIADNYTFEKITAGIHHKEPIDSSIEMDNIRFKHWEGCKLVFTSEEFMSWDRILEMVYDSETNKIYRK